MTSSSSTAVQIGKYLITPLARLRENGGFSSTVSIRCGQGRSTHDHVYTFTPEFMTREAALRHATAQGHHWLNNKQAFA